MMTPYLAKQLHKNIPHETLKLLNSNSENPYLVWNNGTRLAHIFFMIRIHGSFKLLTRWIRIRKNMRICICMQMANNPLKPFILIMN